MLKAPKAAPDEVLFKKLLAIHGVPRGGIMHSLPSHAGAILL